MPSQIGSLDLSSMKKAYESVEFGGRNLFASSTATDGYPEEHAVGGTYSIHSMSTSHEAYNLISVEPNASYTVQYWIDDATYPGWVCIQLLNASGIVVSKVTRTYPAADYYTKTFTTPSTAVTALVSGRHLSTSYDYIPAKLMFEKGTKPSDWKKAEEDIQADIDSKADMSDSVEYIVGTQTAATGSWTGVTRDSTLYTGKTISYKLPYAGSGNASLQLKDSAGNNIGPNVAVYTNTTRVTTHFGAGAVINMTYDGTYWHANSIPNTDTVDRHRLNNSIRVAEDLPQYVLAGRSADPNANGYKKLVAGLAIDLTYPIAYMSSANQNGQTYAVASGGTSTAFYDAMPSVNLQYTKSGWTGTQYKMCYVKGTLSEGNKLTVHSDVFTTTEPTLEEDPLYVYVPIGMLASTYEVNLNVKSMLCAFVDGEFRQVTPSDIVAQQYVYIQAVAGTNTMAKPQSWITAADECVSGTPPNAAANQAPHWTTKRPTYQTRYPVIYISQQTKRLDGSVVSTPPKKDDSLTIIDGGHITTGTIDASTVSIVNLNASESIVVGSIGKTLIDTDNFSVTDLADGDQYARTDILDSMGDQLVVNGNGYLGDNTNFSNTVFVENEANNSYGSFKLLASGSRRVTTDMFMPVQSGAVYKLTFDGKRADPTITFSQAMYVYVRFYDVDENEIFQYHFEYVEGSTTTLAQDLSYGDTVVYLTDLSGFYPEGVSTTDTYKKRLIFWNYADSNGYAYPVGTYSRNTTAYNSWSSIDSLDYDNNTITLSSSYKGTAIPAGTSVSQSNATHGDPYRVYIMTSTYSNWYGYSGSPKAWPGAVKAKLRFDLATSSGSDILLTNVSFRRKFATQDDLDEEAKKRKATYAVCNSTRGSQVKEVDADGWDVYAGNTINVLFTNGNSHSSPYMSLRNTTQGFVGTKWIKNHLGSTMSQSEYTWDSGRVITLMYDGSSNFRMLDNGDAAGRASIASTVNSSAVTRSRRIYYRTATAITNGPATPGTTSSAWDTVSDTESSVFDQWTTKPPRLTQNSDGSGTKYPFLYTCEQRQFVGGTIGYTNVRLDDTTTVIDGGTIVTGQIAANRLSVFNADIQKLRTEYIDADSLEVNLEKVKGTLLVSKVDGLEGMLNEKVDYTGFEDLDNYVRGTRYFLTTDSTAVAGKTYYSRTESDGEYQYNVVENVTVGDSVSGYYELESLPDSLDSRLNSFGSELDRQSEDLELLGKAVMVDAENATVSIGYINAAGQFVAAKTRMSEGGFDILDNDGTVITHVGEQIDIGKLEGCHITAVGDHMSFMNGDDEVAYIDVDDNGESVFYMTRSVVVKDMFLGENRWKFFKRENNNLSLKWTGV